MGNSNGKRIQRIVLAAPGSKPIREPQKVLLPMADVIWSSVRPNLRAYALVLDPHDNDVFSTGFTVLTARTTVPFSWLYQFVTTDNFVGHLVNHAAGPCSPPLCCRGARAP